MALLYSIIFNPPKSAQYVAYNIPKQNSGKLNILIRATEFYIFKSIMLIVYKDI
jgi:hypothetical protein